MKALFFILFPIMTSCNVHWCSHLDVSQKNCPNNPDFPPMQTIETSKPKICNDWSEEETEGLPLIDWDWIC